MCLQFYDCVLQGLLQLGRLVCVCAVSEPEKSIFIMTGLKSDGIWNLYLARLDLPATSWEKDTDYGGSVSSIFILAIS